MRGVVFAVCVAVRLLCTYFSQIPDCDEVFNYWEPLHLLVHGSGARTWEYNPPFALRSWTYILLHWLQAGVWEGVQAPLLRALLPPPPPPPPAPPPPPPPPL